MLKIQPNNVKALYNKGLSLGSLGRYQDAIQYFDKVLKIQPNNVKALYNKGLSLGSLGRYQDAIQYFDKVLEINPNNTKALNSKKDVMNSNALNPLDIQLVKVMQ